MKRLFALLLVFCMMFSLIACKSSGSTTDGGKKADGSSTNSGDGSSADAGETKPKETAPLREDIGDIKVETMQPETDVADSNDEFVNPEKFGGKTLQIYGVSSIVYDDIDNMDGQGNFLWMMRAAADDWAALNNVTLSYEGDYNANTILGAINSGERPDLLMMNQEIPGAANMGIAKAFTEEEYNAIADIIGKPLLDCMMYKNECYGLLLPWSGATWLQYNETLFEDYGAKTPLEYYLEGNWTWDTMEKCFESVTKDFDGNGKIDKTDTYGNSTMIYMGKPYQYEEQADGKLVSLVETSKYFRRYAEILYKGHKETLALAAPGNGNQKCYITTTPRPGTHFGDSEWYNFKHLLKYNDAGEVIRAIPMPVFSLDDPQRYTILTQQSMSMMSSCDEPEATLSLICYMMKVGMRYMSEFSCGLYECSYEGMRGASEYSKAYLNRLDEIINERRAEFLDLDIWDQELYEQMVNDVLKADTIVRRRYTGDENLGSELSTMPPASSLPIVAQKQMAWINKYNSLYG